MRLRSWDLPYSENPGMPTEEERGIYCPEGIKIADVDLATGEPVIEEPWSDDHADWCTLDRFMRELEIMTYELYLADADRARRQE